MPGTICFIRLFSFYFCRNPVQGTIIMTDIRFLMSGIEGDVMTGERHYWGGGWGFITRHKGVSPPPLWWWGGLKQGRGGREGWPMWCWSEDPT